MKSIVWSVVLLLCIVSVTAKYTPVAYTPYTPLHTQADVENVTKSGCSPPATVTGCAACHDDYPSMFKQDCSYYFAARPSDCGTIYTDKNSKNNCVTFLFREKIKDPEQIVSTCKLLDADEYSIDFCISGLALEYGTSDICASIPASDDRARDIREGCYRSFANKDRNPGLCSNIQNVDSAIDCCMQAKYDDVTEQYVTSRQDLIDSYTQKYGADRLNACKQLLQIKAPAVDGACEDVNCECLKPCNSATGDAQNKCAQDCSVTYVACYDKKRQEMVQESRDRFMQQSFYGTFSRKQCAEYQGLAGALKTQETHNVVETTECKTSNDCGDNRICSVCGKCMAAADGVLASNVKIDYKVVAEQPEQKIKNVINENAVFRVDVSRTLSVDGKDIDYCQIAAPGLPTDVRLNAAITDEEIFSGFTTGHITDDRSPTQSCSIDLSQPDKKCIFIISPNDRKKPVGLVKDVDQNFRVFLMQGNEVIKAEDEALKLTLTASGPTVNFNMGTNQVQQGGVKAIKFTPVDPDTQLISVRAKVIGPGQLFEPAKKDITLDTLTFTSDPGKEVTIGYQSPELGNFDIGAALNSLSMWDLQKEAGKAIAKDALLAGVDVGLDKAGEAVKQISDADQAALNAYKMYIKEHRTVQTGQKTAEFVMNANKAVKFEQDANKLIKEYKFGKGVINDLSGIYSGIKDTTGSVGQNIDDTNGGATTTETIANAGVTGINVLQLGVGVLTFVPNKIPGVGMLTSGVQAAFSAATNIWKANLQYIAQDEKIGRAQEKFMPVMVMIVVEDLSGWQTTSTVTLQVAYQEV